MSSELINNLNGREFRNRKPFQDKISNLPSAHNPIYKKKLAIGCRYCTDKTGRRKNFKTLWRLYLHMKTQHGKEPSYKDLAVNIADLINKGVLL